MKMKRISHIQNPFACGDWKMISGSIDTDMTQGELEMGVFQLKHLSYDALRWKGV